MEERFLSPKDIAFIKEIIQDIENLANKIREPIDPKLEPLLEVAHSLLLEQLELDKEYEWGEIPEKDDRFLNNSDIPSVDDLRKMMGEE